MEDINLMNEYIEAVMRVSYILSQFQIVTDAEIIPLRTLLISAERLSRSRDEKYCCNCGKLVKLNKWLFGSLHLCSLRILRGTNNEN